MAATAAAIIGALAATASAGSQIAGTLNTHPNVVSPQYAANAEQNSRNQEQYQQLLNALALKRSSAGYSDNQGNTVQYNPVTNQWESTLGPQTEAVQRASDQASIARNTTDLREAERANQAAELTGITARSAAGPARAAIENFRPMGADALAGLLQDRETRANNVTQEPLVADTLRQFARTGTAAAPVLDQLMRTRAQGLRDTVSDSTLKAMTGIGDVNNANLGNLTSRYSALMAGSSPSLQFSNLSTQNPRDIMTNLIASRASAAGTAPSSAAYATSGASDAVTRASTLGAANPPQNNFDAAQTKALGSEIGDFGKSIATPGQPANKGLNQVFSFFNTPGNSYDPTNYGQTAPPPGGDAGSQALQDMGWYRPLGT